MIYDVIVVGLGASGVSACIYAKRSGLNVLCINFGSPGGIIGTSSVVENYPGFVNISGVDLAMDYYNHFNSLNVPLKNEEVIEIKSDDVKTVITNKNQYKCKKVIICSGRKNKKLGIDNENEFIGKGISYCAVCDGNLYKDKDVIVVGGGNSALENALYLSKLCNKVYILVRKDRFIGDKTLINDVLSNNKIEICFEEKINSLLVDNDILIGVISNKRKINASCIFINIGYEPSISLIDSLDIKKDGNYILVDENMETSIKGIYACGDIIKKSLYQLVTAVSDGAIAANHCYKSLNK